MRIGINARDLASPVLRGINRYTVNLVQALYEIGADVVLYSDRPLDPAHQDKIGEVETRVSPPMRYPVWEQIWLPRQLKSDGAGVFHSPGNFGIPLKSPCPTVLTLHDAIAQAYVIKQIPLVERYNRHNVLSKTYQWMARKKADSIITVSRHAKNDLISFLGLPEPKIEVIYEAADPFFAFRNEAEIAATVAKFSVKKPYLFYSGGWESRKNVPFLLKGFKAAGFCGLQLVIAGGNPAQRKELAAAAESMGIGEHVVLLPWISDNELRALYHCAEAFVYPSLYEGFGLQACEAMSAGTPVFAARATSLPEIVGDGGMTFSLETPAELGRLIRRLADDTAFAAGLRSKALKRSRDFSWTETARKTLAHYLSLVK